jgi:hypothetical protein
MKKHPFTTVEYLKICLQNERETLGHLIEVAPKNNQPLDDSAIDAQQRRILRLTEKMADERKKYED